MKTKVCREYQRGACRRAEAECRYAHPPEGVALEMSPPPCSPCSVGEAMTGGVALTMGPLSGAGRAVGAESLATVTVCMDAVRGRCCRQPCRYFHPPAHLVPQIQANQLRARSTAATAATTATTATTVLSSAVLPHCYMLPDRFFLLFFTWI